MMAASCVRALRARIKGNERLRGGFYLLRLEVPAIAEACAPGQFIMLKGSAADWPYLKRPFSIYSSDGDSAIELVYKVVGRATAAMARTSEGEYEVLGPLGKGFTARPGRTHTIALAGGAGLPPVAYYCQKYLEVEDKLTLVIGAKTVKELLLPVGMLAQGVDVRPYTEDGSKGTKGTVVDGLLKLVGDLAVGGQGQSVRVIACGPRQMLSRVAGICRDAGLPCDVSLEEVMACGLGACLACAVPRTGGGYLHACQDGPVVDAARVDWERWKA